MRSRHITSRERRRGACAAPGGRIVSEEDESEPWSGDFDLADVVGLIALGCLDALCAHETAVGLEDVAKCLDGYGFEKEIFDWREWKEENYLTSPCQVGPLGD
jgi:hypothetical protein